MASEHRVQTVPRHSFAALRGAGAEWRGRAASRLRDELGGPARTQVIVLFACVLALNTADLSSLGAIASKLKPALHLNNTELGVLAAAPSFVAALATLPMGVIADRARRVRGLASAVAVWAVGMVLEGGCSSFDEMLVVRLFLGLVTAAAGPFLASLVGDLFWPSERGRVWGYILAGELLGAGFGLLVAGNLAGVSWRAAIWVLALPSFAVAVGLWKLLPEPARGGASRLARGARRVEVVPAAGAGAEAGDGETEAQARRPPEVERAIAAADIAPRRELVLEEDPTGMAFWQAVRYVLRVPTNVRLIVASALGYFFQAGVNTFGVVFVIDSFGVSQPIATWLLAVVAIGALAGTVLGGRLSDRLLARGRPQARMRVAGACFIISSLLFIPGVLSHDLAVAIPIYVLAAAALGAPNAPADAARLDIIPGALWGRAEAIRTVLRTVAVAFAPLLFGFLSDELASGSRTHTKGLGYNASGPGLRYTFLLMLLPMAVGGWVLLRGAGGYTRDVASALASEKKIARRSSARAAAVHSR